ncbi:MAG TPA: hypothetical protein VKS21_00605, partial [Spirochaetota bacterium]|nr:hypothetical protein [Spirochaetota bacterium]
KDLFNDDIFQTVFGAMSFSFADSEIGMGVGYNRIGYKGRQDINYNENIILSGIGYDILALLKKNTAIRSIFQQMSVGFAFKAHIYRYLDYYGNSGDFNLGFNLKMKEKFFNIALAGVLYNTLARVIYDEWSKIERGHLMRYAALGISSELVNIIPGTARAGFDIELSGIDKHTSSTGLTIKAGLGYTLPFEWLGFAVGMEKGKNSFILSDAVIIRAGDIFRAELASEWLAEASGDGFPLRFNIGGRLNF